MPERPERPQMPQIIPRVYKNSSNKTVDEIKRANKKMRNEKIGSLIWPVIVILIPTIVFLWPSQ